MSRNDGKSLELLTKLIESLLLPKGFEVETRKRIFNDLGIQIAEFDIVIKNKADSEPFYGLIECRDRPSRGAAPGEWIEQLYGRKHRFKFDKVMAVSSTGFSDGAKETARELGVELRNLETVTANEISNWLPQKIPLTIQHGEYTSVFVNLIDDGQFTLNQVPFQLDTKDTQFFRTGSSKAYSLLEIWQNALNNNQKYFEEIEPNGDVHNVKIIVNQSPTENLKIKIDEKIHEVSEIIFEANLRKIIPEIPLIQVAKYSELDEDKSLAKVARWKSKDSKWVDELILIGIKK